MGVPQLLPTTKDSSVSPPATRAKATMAMRRGVSRSYIRTMKMAEAAMASV